jgi:O-antigen/teichoic acid export membrane protein
MPNDFGIMGIAMMLIGYANLFTDFGLSEAVIQKGIRDTKTLNSIFTFNLAVSGVLALLFYASSGFIATFFKSTECEKVIKVLSFFFVITSFSAVPYAMLRRDMNFKTLALLSLSSSMLMSASTLILAFYNYGYWALAFGQLIPTVLITGYVCYRVRWVPVFTYNHSSMKHIIDFGIWNFFKTQLGFVAQHTDRFIIGRWLGTVSLGFYDKALTIAEMPYNTLTMNINGVMFSAFSRIKDDKLQLQQQFKKTLTLLSFLKFPIYFGLIVIAPYFVHSTLGDKWGSMIAPFQIILISYLFKSFGGMSASLNVGIGNYRNHTVRFLIAFVIFVLSCFLLLRFNITGIALGYLIFTIFQIIFSLDLSLKSIDLRWKDVWLSIWPGALASFFMFVIIFSITHFILTEYTFINMAITIFVGALSYCLFIYYDKSKLTLDFRELALADIKNIFQHIFNAA